MRGTSLRESLTEKKCPLCGRGLARTHGPEIPCTLCVRLGPPSVRLKEPTLKHGGNRMSKQRESRFKISITEREHATILAALRLWQEADEHNRGDLRDIAEAAGVPLSNEEIDALCEQINFTSIREA